MASPDRRLHAVLRKAKSLAREYRRLTGKPLGVTGGVAEYEASRILGISLMPARHAGWDALETHGGGRRRLQIKGRVILDGNRRGQRLGRLRVSEKWDAVLMVLLDERLDAIEIWEAGRRALVKALSVPGSRSRNERGALGVSKFKSIGKLRWRRA